MLPIVVIATVCAVAIAQPSAAVNAPTVRSIFTALAMVSVVALAVIANLVRSPVARSHAQDREAHVWDSMNLIMWALMSVFCVQVMRWPGLLRWTIGEEVPLLDECAILVTLLVPLFIAWMILGQSPTDHWRGLRIRERAAAAWLRMRVTIVLTLLPLLVISCASDCLAKFWPDVPASYRSAVYVGCLVGMITLFPVAIRTLWKAEPLAPSALRSRLLSMATQHRVQLTDICVWHTGGTVANAFVTGVIAPIRYVFLTDRLLSQLDDDQVALAFAHELAHVVKRHLLLRTLALLAPLSILLVLSHFVVSSAASDVTQISVSALGSQAELLLSGLTLVFLGMGLGWYSRQLEHQADLWACLGGAEASVEAVGTGDLSVRALHRETARQYISALARLADSRYLDRNGWLHPGYLQRHRFLQQCLCDPRRAAGFSARMSLLAAALYLLSLCGLASLAVSVWGG